MASPVTGQLQMQRQGIGIRYDKHASPKTSIPELEAPLSESDDQNVIGELEKKTNDGYDELQMRFSAIEDIILKLTKKKPKEK